MLYDKKIPTLKDKIIEKKEKEEVVGPLKDKKKDKKDKKKDKK